MRANSKSLGLLAALVFLLPPTALAEIVYLGKYNGVVIFDRWDGCYLYAGARVSAISDHTKEKLRSHAGEAVLLDVRRLDQFRSTSGDLLLQEYEVLGPAEEGRKDSWHPKIDGLQLTADARFEANADELIIEVRNNGSAPAELRMDSLAPTVLAKNKPGEPLWGAADGPSHAVITRCSLEHRCERNTQIDSWVLRASLTLAPGSTAPDGLVLAPGQAREFAFVFELPPGEYAFLGGYGGGHSSRPLASNVVSFDVDASGRARLAGESARTTASKRATRGTRNTICGIITNQNGSTAGSAQVFLWPDEVAAERKASHSAVVAQDGSFRISSVRPGRYRLSAQVSGTDQLSSGFFGGRTVAEAIPIDVPDEVQACRFNFVLYPQKLYALRGVARTEDNWTTTNAGLVLQMTEGDAYPFEVATVPKPNGEFAFSGLPEGRYHLMMQAGGAGSSQEILIPEDEYIPIRLPKHAGEIDVSTCVGQKCETSELWEPEGDESQIEHALRELVEAQQSYAAAYKKGFSPDLSSLGPPPYWAYRSEASADLVDFLPSRSPGGGNSRVKRDGYVITYTPAERDPEGRIRNYTIQARPLQYGKTGTRSFFADESGSIHATTENRAATAADPVADGQ